MAVANNSDVSTINGPQFLDLQPLDINPLISKCIIKVFYLGANRNGSYFDKQTADKMALTLRGTPIVAAWNKETGDYGGHGNVITIEDGEVKFSCKTIPYGFVPPDAKVWYQDYVDTLDNGETANHTYLMTEGYLWTGQFEEEMNHLMSEGGQPQSMELESDSMDGYWASLDESGVEFFIVNDAIFSKLCILSNDCPPCFEGASVVPAESYSLTDNNFQSNLYSMMKDLENVVNYQLNNNEAGGGNVDNITEDTQTDFSADEAPVEVSEEVVEELTEEVADEVDESEDFACGGSDKKKKYATDDDDKDKDEDDVDDDVEDDEEDDDDKDKKRPAGNHSLESDLAAELEALKSEVAELRAYRLEQENIKKDALINKYHMLSPEDKAEIIEHKSEYSYDEIEAKLALLYVKNNVDFSTVDGKEEEVTEEVAEDPISTFSLDDETEFVPPVVSALREVKNNHKFY